MHILWVFIPVPHKKAHFQGITAQDIISLEAKIVIVLLLSWYETLRGISAFFYDTYFSHNVNSIPVIWQTF